MKKLQAILILFLLSGTVFAQKECELIWKNVFPLDPKWKMINDDATLILEGTLNEIAMIDAVGGKVLWQLNFKKSLGVKSAEGFTWNKEKGYVQVRVKGDKKNEEKTTFYDEKTGAPISDITQMKAKWVKSKTRYTSYINLSEKGVELLLTYQNRTLGELMKKKPLSMTIECSGKMTWTRTIEAKVTSSITRNREEGGEPIIDMSVQGDKVFLIYDGISAIDLNTGNVLWSTSFDNSEFDFGVFKLTQTLGRGGVPLATNDGVYIVDLSKEEHCIKKLDLETGKLLWKSEKIDKDAIVPELTILNNVLVAHYGGRVLVETFIPGSGSNPDVYKNEYIMVGDFALKGYDATSGKLLWETNKMKELGDKFSKSLTNMIKQDGRMYVASDKNFYQFSADGKTKFSTPLSKAGLGVPYKIFENDRDIIVVFEEGIASYSMESGQQNYATPTKKAIEDFRQGDAYFMWTGKDQFSLEDFVRIDLKTGKILSKMKDTPYPYFSENGNEFIRFKGEQYYRYKTN